MRLIKIVISCILVASAACSCTSSHTSPVDIVKADPKKVVTADSTKVVPLNKTEAAFPDITGFYKSADIGNGQEPCDLSVTITKLKKQYFYSFSIQDSIIKGKVTVSKSDNKEVACVITFEGIKWASYEGNIMNEDDDNPAPELDVPVGIGAGFSNNEISFQNDGNSMNSYTVLEACGQKFIRLVKQ